MAISSDVCEKITSSIIAELERGVMPWVQPWENGAVPTLPRRHTGEAYRGVNILILWAAAHGGGYRSNVWMTFKQALEYNASVKKGERGTQIIFASKLKVEGKEEAASENGAGAGKIISFLKAYTVFNADQIEGLPDKFNAAPAPVLTVVGEEKNWDDYAEQIAWLDRVPAKIDHTGTKAFFTPLQDKIVMPPRDTFKSAQGYLSTRAHETIHWTGHAPRLDRTFGKRFGDSAYAMEELVAELGAAFTMAELGLAPLIREDHAPYIASWIKVLKNDNRALITAAAKASDALALLCGFQGEDMEADSEDLAEAA